MDETYPLKRRLTSENILTKSNYQILKGHCTIVYVGELRGSIIIFKKNEVPRIGRQLIREINVAIFGLKEWNKVPVHAPIQFKESEEVSGKKIINYKLNNVDLWLETLSGVS
jgi:hypothetical protein